MPDQPLDSVAIQAYIAEVADELNATNQHRLIIVGGALLAWRRLRDTTRDVDTVERLDHDLKEAVARVAQRHDLAPAWLNDSAAGHLPATFQLDECDILWEHPKLVVLGIPMDQLFLMKLAASRAADTDDLEAIWPRCTFGSPESAAQAFYEAYPHEEHDPFLAAHISDIVESDA